MQPGSWRLFGIRPGQAAEDNHGARRTGNRMPNCRPLPGSRHDCRGQLMPRMGASDMLHATGHWFRSSARTSSLCSPSPGRWGTRRPGSSPRGRGTLRPGCGGRICGRFIPAWAGNTVCREYVMVWFPVHPRVGGEHRSVALSGIGFGGSSPRGRGTLCEGADDVHGHRFIPAWAAVVSHSILT